MNIFHIYANDKNLGDQASSWGVKYFLEKGISEKVFFRDHFAIFNLSKKEVNYVNSNFDGVVIGGGGLLRNGSDDKFILSISKEMIEMIKKPIFTYAIGINYEEEESVNVPKLTEYVSQKFCLNSVRDKLSQSFIKGSKLVLCPSMLIKDAQNKKISNQFKKVGIVPVSLSRLKNPKEYVLNLRSFINELKGKCEFFIIPHSKFPEDACYKIGRDNEIKLLLSSNPGIIMDFYAEMDLIIGSRGHSLIFATGQEIPFISLSYNIKCDEFSRDINYPKELSLKANDFSVYDLLQSIEYLRNNYSKVKELLIKTKEIALEQNKNYVSEIAAKIKAK